MTDSEFPSIPVNSSFLKSADLRILHPTSLLTILADQFDSIFRTNTTGPYYLSRALMRSWLGLPISLSSSSSEVNITADDGQLKKNLKGKQILFVSSISGLVAMTPQYQAAYNASKAGVTMLAKVSEAGYGWNLI